MSRWPGLRSTGSYGTAALQGLGCWHQRPRPPHMQLVFWLCAYPENCSESPDQSTALRPAIRVPTVFW